MVERKITTDRNRAFAMLLAAQLTEKAWHLLRAKAKSTATKPSNMAWNMQIDNIPNLKFGNGTQHLQPEHLIEFGCIGYVTTRKQIKRNGQTS